MMQINSIFIPDTSTENSNKTKTNLGLKNFSYLFSNIFNIQKNEVENAETSLLPDEESPNLLDKTDLLLDVSFLLNPKNEKNSSEVLSILKPFATTEQIESLSSPINKAQENTVIETLPMSESDFLIGFKSILAKFLKGNSKSKAPLEIIFNSKQTNLTLKPDKKLNTEIEKLVHSELENNQNFSIILKKNGTDIYIDVETHSIENLNVNHQPISNSDFESEIQSSTQQVFNNVTELKEGVANQKSNNQLNVASAAINNQTVQPENVHSNSIPNLLENNTLSDGLHPNNTQDIKNSINDASAVVEEGENKLAVNSAKIFSLKNNVSKKITGLVLNQENLNVISNIENDNLRKVKTVPYSLPQTKAEGKLLNDSNYNQKIPETNKQKNIAQSFTTQPDSSSLDDNIEGVNNKGQGTNDSTTSKGVNLNRVKISNHLPNNIKVESVSTSELDQLIKDVNVKEIVIEDSSKQSENKLLTTTIIDKISTGSDKDISITNTVKTKIITGQNLESDISPKFIRTTENKSNTVQTLFPDEINSETQQNEAPIKTVQQAQSINSLSTQKISSNQIEIPNTDLQELSAKQNLGNNLTDNKSKSKRTQVETPLSDLNTENTLHFKTKSLKVDSIRIQGSPDLVITKNIFKPESDQTKPSQNKFTDLAVEKNPPVNTNKEPSKSHSLGDSNISSDRKFELNKLDGNILVDKQIANSKTLKTEQIFSQRTEKSEPQFTTKEVNSSLNSVSTILTDRNESDLVSNTINKQEASIKIANKININQEPPIIDSVPPVVSKIKVDNSYALKNEVINNKSLQADAGNILTSLHEAEPIKIPTNQINFYKEDATDAKTENLQNNKLNKSELIFPQKNISSSTNSSKVSSSITENIIEPNITDKTPKEFVLKNTVMNDTIHQQSEIFSPSYSTQAEKLISKDEAQVLNSNLPNQSERNTVVKQTNNFELTDNIIASKINNKTSDKQSINNSDPNIDYSDNKELKEYVTSFKTSRNLNEVKNTSGLNIEKQNIANDKSQKGSEEISSKNFTNKDVEKIISVTKEKKELVKENLPLKSTSSSKASLIKDTEEYSAAANPKSEIKTKPNTTTLENSLSHENINAKIESTVKSPITFENNIIENELIDKRVFNKQSLQIDPIKNNIFDEAALTENKNRFDKTIETKDSNNYKNIPQEKNKIDFQEKEIGSSSNNYKEVKSLNGRLGINQSINSAELLEEEVQIDNFKNTPVEKREVNFKEKVIAPSSTDNQKEVTSMKEQLEVKKSFSDTELSEDKIPIQNFKKQGSQIEKPNLSGNIVEADNKKVVEITTDNVKESDNNTLEANKIHLKIRIYNQNSSEVIDKKQSSLFENIFSVVDNNTKTLSLPKTDKVKSNLNNDQEIKPLENKLKSADSEQKIVTETKSENNSSTQDHSKEDPASYKVLHNQVNDKIENKVEHLSKEPLQHKQVRTSELVKEIYKIIESGETKSVSMKLIPENLGSVKILLDTIDTKVTARVEVENQTVQKLIQTNVEVLKQSLQQNGVQLNSINVSLSSPEQKQSNLHGNKKRYQQLSSERKLDSTDEKVSIKNFGYNTYEFLA